MYKFRHKVVGAEQLHKGNAGPHEPGRPVFKIRNAPRMPFMGASLRSRVR